MSVMTPSADFSSVFATIVFAMPLSPLQFQLRGTVWAVDRLRKVSYCYSNVKHFLMKNATLRQLRVFASVARHLSFIRAAEELKLTAPAVSMQIKDLEIEVGLPLFDRTSRQVSLTMVGEYVLAHTRRVLSAMRDAEDLVARFRGLQTGPLDVGMVSTAKYFLPRLLAQFREEHPGIEIRLQVANNREQIVVLMQEGDIELAIMGRPPEGWATRAEPFAMHPHVLVTAIDHRFSPMEAVAVTEGLPIMRRWHVVNNLAKTLS